jgi:hypothetical protein
MAGGGQDRAAALGWRKDFHSNRPKTFARILTIPQKATVVAKLEAGDLRGPKPAAGWFGLQNLGKARPVL